MRADPPMDRLIDAFEAHGFTLQGESFGVVNLDADGDRRHRVILVPKTGRLQLRLDYTTPHEERDAEAARVGTLLARILEEGDALPP